MNERPSDIPESVWSKAYEFLSETNTSIPIEGLDFLIVQEAMARAIMSGWAGLGHEYQTDRLWFADTVPDDGWFFS